jgi:predicted metalloprotease with PDZ domain
MRLAVLLTVAGLFPSLGVGQAPRPVEYEISFPNAAHHEAEITVTFRGVPTGPLQVRMSRSSPGRYAAHEFAKNVYNVRIENSRGRPLTVARPNPHQWDVTGHDGLVRVRYTLFADRADGTYSGIDRSHAHLNIPATFMWARGMDRRPVRVRFSNLPAEWAVATQLAPTDDPAVFTARDLQYFMDSPIELSDFDLRSWTVRDSTRQQTIRLAIHHQGTRAEVDSFVDGIRKIVREQQAIYGEFPKYDHGSYTFLADYLPWDSGDGMEHRNSTVLTSTGSLEANARGLLGTVSHEYFHSWNVERIRPKSIEPFSFEDANISGELWLAEGFTSYFGPLAMMRAGLTPLPGFARGIGAAVSEVVNSPGRRYHSPREMSMLAPFVDAATALDPTSFSSTFISYYTWGQVLGLGLDLTLRERFPGITADDFMREMWRVHGRTERPYTNADARAALGRVTRDTAFANDFWRRFIEGREVPDYGALLAQAGILLRQADPASPWLGSFVLHDENGQAMVRSPVLVGTPAYDAGLEIGDQLLTLNGQVVSGPADLAAVLAGRKPGDRVTMVFESRGQRVESEVTLEADPRLEAVLFEEAGREVTEAIREFRAAWLGSKVRP